MADPVADILAEAGGAAPAAADIAPGLAGGAKKSKFLTGGRIAGGLGLLAALLAPGVIEGWKSSRARGRKLQDYLDNPELLREEYDAATRDGAFKKLVTEHRMRQLAAIGGADPKKLELLRALEMGMDQPRLTGSEVRIGGPNDFEAVDRRIADSPLFDEL